MVQMATSDIPERRFDDDENDPERTGAPIMPTRHDRGISTEIGRKTDARGNDLSSKKRKQLGRLRREHSHGRWRTKAERNLAQDCPKFVASGPVESTSL